MRPSDSEARRAAFDALVQVQRLTYSREALGFIAQELADIPTRVFVTACHRLIRRADGIRNVVAAILKEAAECRNVGGEGVATTSYAIVCELCGERREVGPGDGGWGKHFCEMQTRIDAWRATPPNQRPPWPITDDERAKIHAKGLAATTGRAQKVEA